MNEAQRSTLLSLLTLLMLCALPTVALAGWRVLPTTGFVTDDLDLTLMHRRTGLDVTSQVNGDQHFIYQTVPVVEGDVIDAIAICYVAGPPFAGTFITGLGLTEFIFPMAGTGRHVDSTDLTSSAETCYLSPVANFAPAGAVTLWLQLNFDNASDFLFIGAVGIHVK